MHKAVPTVFALLRTTLAHLLTSYSKAFRPYSPICPCLHEHCSPVYLICISRLSALRSSVSPSSSQPAPPPSSPCSSSGSGSGARLGSGSRDRVMTRGGLRYGSGSGSGCRLGLGLGLGLSVWRYHSHGQTRGHGTSLGPRVARHLHTQTADMRFVGGASEGTKGGTAVPKRPQLCSRDQRAAMRWREGASVHGWPALPLPGRRGSGCRAS